VSTAALDAKAAPKPRARVILLALSAGLLMTAGSLVMLAIGIVTLFQARRLYAWMAKWLSRGILALYGIKIAVHGAQPFPRTQTVYISNHVSTLDLFILVALGLPSCRFFLSGFLRKFVPLGIIATLMGTFFTVPQSRPAERARIFQRAARILRRTRESVYLSPEGGRITTGDIGHFNKGSFHLATALRAPIQPMFFRIPPEIDPVLGFDARPGTAHVYVMDPIDTSGWKEEDAAENAARVREMFVRVNEEMRCR
jgi:1-acyl-sn-glycerol-3-phosphate acyltransferase